VSEGAATTGGDYWDSWFNLHDQLVARLKQAKPSRYWERWFSAYSQEFSKQIQTRTFKTVLNVEF
jgi:hypothetical protein